MSNQDASSRGAGNLKRALVAGGILALCHPFVSCSSTKEPVTPGDPVVSRENAEPTRRETNVRKDSARDRLDGKPSRNAPQSVSRLEISAGDMDWGEVTRAGARTHVLIYAATEAISKNYGLAAAEPSARALKEAFEGIGVDPSHVTIRKGAEVAAVSASGGVSKVQNDIRNIASELTGEQDNLVVVWIGHGAHADNDLQLMTSDTDSDAGRLTGTLPSRDLSSWLNQAKTDSAWGNPSLSTALIIDACQTNAQGSPGTSAVWDGILESVNVLADVKAYSAEPGEEAWVDPVTGRTAYSNALCRVIGQARQYMESDPVSLKTLLERVREDKALDEQRPPAPAGKGEVVLFDPNNLSLEIKVVDDLGNVIPNATVKFQDSEKAAPAVFEGLGASREGYSMQVSAPGYFTRNENVRLSRAQSGRTLQVPLAREFVVLRGYIRLPEGERGAIRVAVDGSYEGLVTGYHTTSDSMTGSGQFDIKLPRFEGERKLTVTVTGQTRYEEVFDLATQSNHHQPVTGGRVIVFDFGDTTLPPRGVATGDFSGPGDVAVDIGGVKFSFDFNRLVEADFIDRVGWSLYKDVNTYVTGTNKNWKRAERVLDELRTKRYILTEKSYILEELVEELGVAAAIHIAKQDYDAGNLSQAIAGLRQSNQLEKDRVRVLFYSMLMQGAGHHFQVKNFEEAISLYEEAAETQGEEESEATLYAEQALLAWMEESVKNAYKSGDWVTPRRVLKSLTEKASEEVVLKYAGEIEKQSISHTCRLRFNEAQVAYGDGQFDKAVELYRQALDAKPNAHYSELIRKSLEDVSVQLFDYHLTIGSEMVAKGDHLGALDAYLACCKYYPGAGKLKLEFLVQDYEDRYRTEAPKKLDQAKKFLKSREIVEDYDRDLEAGDFAGAEKTLKDIERGGVDSLELERLRRRMALAREDQALAVFSDYDRYKRQSKVDVKNNLEFFESAHPRLRAGLKLDSIVRFDSEKDSPWIAVYTHEATQMEFSLIPGGFLKMGDAKGMSNQKPVTQVELYPFLMARTEVSYGVYGKHKRQKASISQRYPKHPVPTSHVLAREWCDNVGMALPTEAQWEWAALAAKPNERVKCEAPATEEVGSGQANAFGLLNIYTNIAEWCQDAYQDYSVAVEPLTGLRRGEAGERGHVLRGGSYDSPLNTGAKRRRFSKVIKAFTGFRPVINVVANPNN